MNLIPLVLNIILTSLQILQTADEIRKDKESEVDELPKNEEPDFKKHTS